ncbi:MAG: class D beta-lactamase [Deltaproteobacteria bacterium]|nr:class D beta-lactamase [Deltaproteobacteria bacterium]
MTARYATWASIALILTACNRLDAGKVNGSAKTNNPYATADISHFMEGMDATFVFLDVQRNIEVVHNPERAKTRFSPCSTFKIPNSLVALETGVMQGAQSEISWDKTKYPKQPFWDDIQKNNGLNWETDHTLQSAFKNSCVWCYMEIAERIGTERMQTFVDRFGYGNRDISSGKWPFWLESSLQISAKEQVAFLKRFVLNELGLSQKTIREGRSVFKREQKGASVLYAKTGSGNNIGWFVGFVEKEDNKYVFVFNMGGNYKIIAAKRISVSMELLGELGVWPVK